MRTKGAEMSERELSRMTAYSQMVDTYRSESDRAAAVLATSFLDNTLRSLLLAYMVEDPKVGGLFEGDRPLATFSARVTVAFGLGLLSPDRFSDLELIRRIRNQFAHSEEAISFDTSPIREWCAALWIAKQRKNPEFLSADVSWDHRTEFLLVRDRHAISRSSSQSISRRHSEAMWFRHQARRVG